MGKAQRAIRQKTARAYCEIANAGTNLYELLQALEGRHPDEVEKLGMALQGLEGIQGLIEDVFLILWEKVPEDWESERNN